MTTGRDKMGRPLVVVTGLGVVTSLGAGKADNWAKLTAGESGIKTITRFPTDGLKTRIAGTIDYLPPQSSNAALTESFAQLAADEAVTQSGVSGTGRFPGPLFLAVPPIEMEWPQRLEFGANGQDDVLMLFRQAIENRLRHHQRFQHEPIRFAAAAGEAFRYFLEAEGDQAG